MRRRYAQTGRAAAFVLALGAARVAAQPGPVGPPLPTTKVGSLAPDVYLDDISYTLRLQYFKALTVSPDNPSVAYATSYSGYVFKTIDGGKTWDESRLVVEPRPFFGDSLQYLYFGWQRLSQRPSFGLDEEQMQRAFDQRNADRLGRGRPSSESDVGGGGGAAGSGGGAAANIQYGIGLPGRAPRLQLFLRRWFKPTSGINIKQTLLLQGLRVPEIRLVVINPHDPKILFACTGFGLYKSYDAGLNWVRVFTGTRFFLGKAVGRNVWHAAVDPKDPKKVLAATGEGLFISTDGGENFMKTTKTGVGDVVIDWIYFNPYDSRFVFVGTDYGLLRSADGGESWEWIYFTTYPAGRVVRSIVLDPFDKKRGYIATHDGLYTTPDMLHGGLESWARLGGMRFTGVETWKIDACPKHKGHLWAVTNMRLVHPILPGTWDTGGSFIVESVDGGENWKEIYSGHTHGSIQWFEKDPTDPDLLWIVWSRALSRMRRMTAEVETKATEKGPLPDDPPIGEVLMASQRYFGVEPARQLTYRYRSRLKAFVPRLEASYTYHRWSDYDVLHDARYYLPFYKDAGWRTTYSGFQVMLVWDLSDYVFNLSASLFGRIDRVNGEIRAWLLHAVHFFYGELRRLRAMMARYPPKDLRIRLMYKLRIEELTSYINLVSGNYLTWWRQGHRDPGYKTKWWEAWPVSKGRR